MTTTDTPISYIALMRWIRENGEALIHEAGIDTPRGELAMNVVEALARYQAEGKAENEAKLRKAVLDYREAME